MKYLNYIELLTTGISKLHHTADTESNKNIG
jgi:hypothetical protein